jgi:hypothetical protein
VLRHLRDRYLGGRELAADRAAIAAAGDTALAGALFKVLDGPEWTDLGAAAALGGGVLDQRIEQLEGGVEPPVPVLPRRAVAQTAAALATLSGLFVLTVARSGSEVLAMDGSMRDGGGLLLTVAGSLVCTAAMAALAVVAIRSGRRHPRIG